MKIAITALGTRGDLQPFIALAIALKAAGHEVWVISSKNEEEFVTAFGIAFFPLSVNIRELMEGKAVQKMSKGNNAFRFFVSHLKGSRELKQTMVSIQQEIWDGCKDADVILYHPGMPIGFFIAKELGKISILATPFPAIATKDYPSILFYAGPRLGALYNRITHFLFERLFWGLSRPAIEQFWNTGTRSAMNFTIPAIRQQIGSGMPVLNGYSKRLFPPSREWSSNIHTTGSWLMNTDQHYTPPPDLVTFLSAGDTPIYIGFGSMTDPQHFESNFAIILEALQKARQRAVIALGWNRVAFPEPVPDNIFLIESIPHSWLFSRVSLVVHHGGAGTTAAGLTAGKPTVIIPHNADQPAWGRKVYELGAGPKPIRKSRLSAGKLSDAILYALRPDIVANAFKLGEELRKEDGVAAAVRVINSYLESKPRGQTF